MRVFQFTHSDLDGIGCAVLAKVAFGDDLKTTFVDYHDVDEKITEFLNAFEPQDNEKVLLLITDIAPTEKHVFDLLDDARSQGTIEVVCLDHHKTSAKNSANFEWAYHSSVVCGTLGLFQRLPLIDEKAAARLSEKSGYAMFADIVNVYDLWKTDDPLRKRSEDLNRLLWFIGRDRFIRLFADNPLTDYQHHFRLMATYLLEGEERRVDEIVTAQVIPPFYMDGEGNTFCVTYATKSVSQVCHAALDRFPELDYAVNINVTRQKGDIRSREGEIDSSRIAEILGGGGRETTAGFEYDFQGLIHQYLVQKIGLH